MNKRLPKVGVLLVESDKSFIEKLSSVCLNIWKDIDILPRVNHIELENAARWVQSEVIIVRSSFLHENKLLLESLFEMYSRGSQLVCIQDTPLSFKETGWIDLGGIYYISDRSSFDELHELLLNCKTQNNFNGNTSEIGTGFDDSEL